MYRFLHTWEGWREGESFYALEAFFGKHHGDSAGKNVSNILLRDPQMKPNLKTFQRSDE